jgi:hypothetical protein
VYRTNGDTHERITKDIDWDAFDGTDKSKWVLHWDAKRLCLIMSTGASDGRYYLIHMAPEHRKDGEQPKWTGPHFGSFDSFASGQVGNKHRLYGGHSSDGSVYTMDRGGTDASEAYSSTQVPLIIKTGKAYADGRDWAALLARLYHTDFGVDTCTLDWEVDADDEAASNVSVSHTVSLSGHKGTLLDLSANGRCEWAQGTITHTGSNTGALRDLAIQTRARGKSGSKRVA